MAAIRTHHRVWNADLMETLELDNLISSLYSRSRAHARVVLHSSSARHNAAPSQLGDLLRAGVQPDLPMLLRQFFWPLMGVVFLSLLLPIGIKLVQMIRARRARSQGGAAPA